MAAPDREESNDADGGTSPPQGDVSLEQLSDAFAQMLDPEDRPSGPSDPPGDGSETTATAAPESDEDAIAPRGGDDPCPVSPHTILEAMLFIGHPENEPLSAERVAELIRGVEAEDVETLVDELNTDYAAEGHPYEICRDAGGYRLALRDEYRRVGEKFYGRIREARLSQAAIEVLALVAYNQPMTSQRVSQLRGHPSGAILSQLVRRELLRLERPEMKPRTPVYHTTPRFLQLFGLATLEELPRTEELDR
ncbi:MAG: SMC-Scp complex subunit ScpB [Planctomycetota bacterium]|nr:MAG: SMC-Scp complex subunit ScpB [Planctomycetota bacterium]